MTFKNTSNINLNSRFSEKEKKFYISYSRRSLISGIIVAIALLLTLILYIFHKRLNLFEEFALGYAPFFISPIVIGLSVSIKIKFSKDSLNKVLNFVLMLIIPIAILTMGETLNYLFEYGFTVLGFFGGYFLILFLVVIFYAIFGNFKISFMIVNTFVLLLSITNFYVFSFRGTPFIPVDFLAAKTAANVSVAYDFSPGPEVLFAILIYLFLMVIFIRMAEPKFSFKLKISSRIICATISLMIVVIYITTNFFVNLGIKPYFWNQYFSCREQGFLLNFVGNFKYMVMTEPFGYNYKDINKYVKNIYSKTNEFSETEEPNIICIMNEALTDFSVLGDFETNIDYMPFMNNLTENTVKGNLYVPVIGGGTSNTEFEFLTGHSMSFLTSGSYAYQSYIKNPICSIVSTLKSQGYSATAFHPYYSSGWNRTNVYGDLGFDKFISIENMLDGQFLEFFKFNETNPTALQEYIDTNKPELSHMFVRQYVSDSYDFEILIDEFEKRDKNKPYFSFNVTMQNHGGYTSPADNLDETVKITSLSKKYDATNRYLSLIKKTDDAFKELIEYFKKVKEPTIICMFGDHQPAVEKEFIYEIMGVDEGENYTKEQNQSRYCTPFFIWANYDIEEKYIDKLSSNYLSSVLLDVANIEMPIYNQYLLKFAETLPVINNAGYIDASDNYYKWDEDSPYEDMIADYRKIQYNNLFDQKNVDRDVFYINNYQPKRVDLSD